MRENLKLFLSILVAVGLVVSVSSGAMAESTIPQFTNNNLSEYFTFPQMNDNGHVVWSAFDGTDLDIFYYDGSTITQLTNNSTWDCEPQINNNGHVVWYGDDGTDFEIFYYDGSTITQLTDNSTFDAYPSFTNDGHVVWSHYEGTTAEIFYYDGSTITKLTVVADAGPAQMVECTSPNGAEVTLNGTGSLNPNPENPLTYTWTNSFGTAYGPTPTVTLPLDLHEITLVVDDGNGQTDADTVQIWVRDTTAPQVQLSSTPDMLWPPNHKMIPVTVSVLADDACDPEPVCSIVAVSSNESLSSSGKGDKAPDWKITGDLTLDVRAERSGKGDGRVYTLTVECVDASGNASSANTEIRVSHDMRKK